MRNLLEFILIGSMVILWLMGVVIAKGFWSTTFAVSLPPYAWYLVVERVMVFFGLV